MIAKGGVRPTTASNYTACLSTLEARGFDVLGLGTMEAYRALADVARREVKNSTYNQYAHALNKLHEVHAGTRPFEPKPPGGSDVTAYNQQELDALLTYRYPANKELERFRRALLLVSLKTGARASEIHGLTLADLHPERPGIRVSNPSKNGRVRWLPMEPWVFSRRRPLQAYIQHKPMTNLDVEPLWTTDFPHEVGDHARQRSIESLQGNMWEIGQELGFPVTFIRGRRSCLTRLHRRGFGLFYLQTWADHEDPKTTLRYIEIGPNELAQLVERTPEPDIYGDR